MPHNDEQKYDVIVIGAGMAGLTAAAHLADLDHTVLVVEAKNRVGGRIHTLKTSDGTPIEMGANTLRNPGTRERPNPLIPLLHHLNLTTMPIEPINSILFNASDYIENANTWVQAAKKIHWKTWPSLGEVLKFQDHKAFQNKLKPRTSEFIGRQILTHMIQQQTGTSPHYVSLLELMHFDKDNDKESLEAFVSGGYQNLPEDMAKKMIATGKVKILLNTPIQSIHYDLKGNKTQVVTINGEKYKATSVLCTVPIGVLKKKKLHFFPELSEEKQSVIKHLKIGFHNKVILEFEKVFWPPDVHFLFPGSKDYHHFPEYLNLFHFSNHKTPILARHFYASEACFKENSDDQIIEKALLPLRHIYGKSTAALKDAFVTHWESDPYALGSSSCVGINSEVKELKNFEQPEPGGLFFAGAHTLQNQNRETVHGAYISGVRAALDINHYLQHLFRSRRLHTTRH